MKVRLYKNEDGSVKILTPINKDKTLDELAEKAGLTGDFEDIEESQLPDRKYRNEWRIKEGGGVEVPTILKESRDALIRLQEIDSETRPFDRTQRELRINAGIATQAEIDAENEAKTLRNKVI